MLDQKKIISIKSEFQRIFTMKITRSTFREIQNVLRAILDNDEKLVDSVFLALLNGKTNKSKLLQDLVQSYSPQVNVAKEVYEKGEYVNFITSDTLNRQDSITYFNRIRRVDGDEFDFATDPSTSIQLINHFLNKLHEVKKMKPQENKLKDFKQNLNVLKETINSLLTDL